MTKLTCTLALAMFALGCPAGDDNPSSEADEEKPATQDDSAASSIDDVPECVSYIKKVEECGDSTLGSRKAAVEKQLAKVRTRSIAKKFCENLENVYTCRRKAERKTSGGSSSESGESAAQNRVGIKECDEYLEKLEKCGESESFVNMSAKGFQIKLDEGKSRSTIRQSCETLMRVYRCKKS